MGQLNKIFFIICLFLFLLSLSITITINSTWLYAFDIDHLNILSYTSLSKSELLLNYKELMAYLNFFWIHSLEMTNFPVSKSGAFHFAQVKQLFQLNYVVFMVTLIPSLYFIRLSFRRKMMWVLIRPCYYLLFGLFAIILFMSVSFNTFFVKFHQLFFNNSAWIFYPETDPIITVLPEQYFMHCFVLFFVLFVFFITGIIIVGKRQLKNNHKRRQKS